MKLSESLKLISFYGNFRDVLNGYSERVEKLENIAWDAWNREALDWGAPEDKAKEYADRRLERI